MVEGAVRVVGANEASWDDLQAVFGRGAAATCQCQRIKLGVVVIRERRTLSRSSVG